MKFFQTIFFLAYVALSCCDSSCNPIFFPRDESDLLAECSTRSGEVGVYRLEKDCEPTCDFAGYIAEAGIVVCCLDKSSSAPAVGPSQPAISGPRIYLGSKAKEYCETHVPTLDEGRFKVSAGNDSGVGEFPHMAALGYANNILERVDYNCGGALISERFVLTAAHCVRSIANPPVIVRLGYTSMNESDITDYSNTKYDIKIKNIKMAPGYVSSTKYHDLALIELETEVTFSEYVYPICLDRGEDDDVIYGDEESRNFTIIGFGMKDYETRRPSDWLQKATIYEMPLEVCQGIYKRSSYMSLPDNIIDSQICANDPKETPDDKLSADTCPGDSGSPLQVTSTSEKYYLIGVTSSGAGCGSSYPALYTRVSSYIEWIESVVWPASRKFADRKTIIEEYLGYFLTVV